MNIEVKSKKRKTQILAITKMWGNWTNENKGVGEETERCVRTGLLCSCIALFEDRSDRVKLSIYKNV